MERQAVFTSDLGRALERAGIAFASSSLPTLADWPLHECDYGDLNGQPAADLHRGRKRCLDRPYPGGESWRQAVHRVGRFLDDLPLRWDGTRWALDHFLNGVTLETLMDADFGWREGREYQTR